MHVYNKPEHSVANVTILYLRPMHQYTHPSAEPKGKAAAKNLAKIRLQEVLRGNKTLQTAKGSFGGQVQERHNFWICVDNSHVCIPDQVFVQQLINNQTSREEDSAEEVASFCRPVPQKSPTHSRLWHNMEVCWENIGSYLKKENAVYSSQISLEKRDNRWHMIWLQVNGLWKPIITFPFQLSTEN